jgi:hypothetical protein
MAGGVFMGDERDRGAVLIRNKKINKNANIEIDSFRTAHLAAPRSRFHFRILSLRNSHCSFVIYYTGQPNNNKYSKGLKCIFSSRVQVYYTSASRVIITRRMKRHYFWHDLMHFNLKKNCAKIYSKTRLEGVSKFANSEFRAG